MTNGTTRAISAPYLVLSVVEANGGLLEGRTKIQKLAYFLSRDGEYDVDFGPHYYGPYSPDVDNALQTLVSFGLLEETSRTPNLLETDKIVFEPKFYRYSLTKKGREALYKKYPGDDPELARIRNQVADMKKTMKGLHTKTLSAAAKIHFILTTLNHKATYEEISKKAEELGWSLRPEEVAAVADLLVDMGFAKKG